MSGGFKTGEQTEGALENRFARSLRLLDARKAED